MNDKLAGMPYSVVGADGNGLRTPNDGLPSERVAKKKEGPLVEKARKKASENGSSRNDDDDDDDEWDRSDDDVVLPPNP